MKELSGKFLTKDEIQIVAKGAIGKTFGELSNENFNYDNKGTLGQLIEKSVFNFANNSNSKPDFESAGIELKLTPYKRNKNGSLSAKERLVLNIINYLEEYKYSFENSHFLYKNRNIQLLWYLFDSKKSKKDYKITHDLYLSLDEKDFQQDLNIIKKDWEFIIEKIKRGEAHNLSESDTMYLGACPKGKNKDSLRPQPFSDKMAMQRAFCYKTSYMSFLVRKYISNKKDEKIIEGPIITKTFEDYIVDKIKVFYGMSEDELFKMFKINTSAKNKYRMIISKMLNLNGDIENSEEFRKSNIKIKTIRVEENGIIKESMSFPAFDFNSLVKEKWQESSIYTLFQVTKFLFIVFKSNGREYCFDHVRIWNMPESILNEEIYKVWNKTKKVLKNGTIVKYVKAGRLYTNFPKINENPYCHVRPHGRNANDTCELPMIDKLTGISKIVKQCFWLNSNYLQRIIGEKH